MASRIPILGMVHRFNIIRCAEIDDGAGGIALGTETAIYTRIRGRVEILSGQNDVANQDTQELFGNESQQRWRFMLPPNLPNLQKSDFLRLHASSTPAPIPYDTKYRIIWIKPQIDDRGKFHHTSVIGELEDVDT